MGPPVEIIEKPLEFGSDLELREEAELRPAGGVNL
jgi:hypothetical protein